MVDSRYCDSEVSQPKRYAHQPKDTANLYTFTYWTTYTQGALHSRQHHTILSVYCCTAAQVVVQVGPAFFSHERGVERVTAFGMFCLEVSCRKHDRQQSCHQRLWRQHHQEKKFLRASSCSIYQDDGINGAAGHTAGRGHTQGVANHHQLCSAGMRGESLGREMLLGLLSCVRPVAAAGCYRVPLLSCGSREEFDARVRGLGSWTSLTMLCAGMSVWRRYTE